MTSKATILLVLAVLAAAGACVDDRNEPTRAAADESRFLDLNAADDADDDSSEADDDAVGDDDTANADLPLSGLLLIGQDDTGVASWRQVPDGWLREAWPTPLAGGEFVFAGPSFFLDGKWGLAAWDGQDLYTTAGYDQLVYDLAKGWRIDQRLQHTDAIANLSFLFAPSVEELWVVNYLVPNPRNHLFSIWRYRNSKPHRTRGPSLTEMWDKLFFLDRNAGLATGFDYGAGSALFERWNGSDWRSLAMPDGYHGGWFRWLTLEAIEHGWFVWESQNGNRLELMRLDGTTWQKIDPPADCEAQLPWAVYGDCDYALVLSTGTRFWEWRDGIWSCRTLPDESATRLAGAVVLRNGQAFVAAVNDDLNESSLFEVTADGTEELSLPAGVVVYALHALGPLAPRFSLAERQW